MNGMIIHCNQTYSDGNEICVNNDMVLSTLLFEDGQIFPSDSEVHLDRASYTL